ncbi:MAG TPA: glycine betaine ABC transporter substrate-binding protein [Devosia sp.]|nr:glycine betaine ABC transporter substrate-binding protein [Devosia sp.]
MNGRIFGFVLLALAASGLPARAQVTVLDQAQDTATPVAPAAPPPICGTQPISIAAMSWPSATLLAQIHARLLTTQFGCQTRVMPGDMAAIGSAMGATGQPAVAPEMWIGRIADVWNTAIKAQMVRPAAPTYAETMFEGWFVPDYLAAAHPELTSAAALKTSAPTLNGGARLRFISCPVDWGCSVINRNLIKALGLSDVIELVEPANRFEMDTLIAEAVGRKEPVVFYYWQPNAVLAQFNFVSLDLGAYDEKNFQCLAQLACATPVPSAFASESVVVALAEWVFTDIPAIAAYFQRSSLPLKEMNTLLAQLNEPGATVESIADRFVIERSDIWLDWVGVATR